MEPRTKETTVHLQLSVDERAIKALERIAAALELGKGVSAVTAQITKNADGLEKAVKDATP